MFCLRERERHFTHTPRSLDLYLGRISENEEKDIFMLIEIKMEL